MKFDNFRATDSADPKRSVATSTFDARPPLGQHDLHQQGDSKCA
ncbi:hypothetical protein U1701_12400 [Sphingomonas sp. PB2P19]